MNIVFGNNGILSLVDITTMGDSCKREDSEKIGEFDSGLKYAIAILHRNGIEISITSGGVEYTFGTKVINPDHKVKEVLTVNGEPTAFSPQLGHNWELWMAYRELYSNCIDEGGEVSFLSVDSDLSALEWETVVVVKDNDFNAEMIENWDKYFIKKENAIYTGNGVNVFENNTEDGHLKLYKHGILIYEDTDKKSQFLYNYSHASIDERRICNDVTSFENKIGQCWCSCENTDLINRYIDSQFEKSFESRVDYYWGFSAEWVVVLNEMQENTQINDSVLYPTLFKEIIEDSRFKLGYARVTHSSPSYSYSKATIEIKEEPTETVATFEESIKKICSPFEVNFPIVKSNIDGYKCLPDRSKKVIYVSEGFEREDLWEMVKAVFRIEGSDNSDYPYKMYAKKIS